MKIKTCITILLITFQCFVFGQKQNNSSKINRPARIMVIPKKWIIDVSFEISLSEQQQKVMRLLA